MKQILLNQKLSRKLLAAPLVIIVFMVLLGLAAYHNLSLQRAAIDNIFDQRFKAYQTGATIVKDIANVHSNLYKIISWADAKYEEKKIDLLGKEQMATLGRAADEIGKALKWNWLTEKEKTSYQTVMDDFAGYRKSCYSAIDLATSDLNYATMFMATADDKYQKLNGSLHELLDLENKLSQDQRDDSTRSSSTALKIFILVLVIATGLSMLISLFTASLVTRPVSKSMEVIQRIAEGDLTQEIELTSRDEIGQLVQSINLMRMKMDETVGQSVVMSQNLSEAASEQSASLEETSSSLEEMTSQTKQNAGNAAQANNLMTAAQQVIEKVDATMNALTESMNEIARGSEETQKIVKTIDEIAFQTNLLALNAAVEAARAGEAGAGFAVVAGEVRNLAMRAAEAAKNTSSFIEDIVTKIRKGEKLVGVTGESFKEIRESSTKVVGLIGEIAEASQEQSSGIDQINRAVAEMNSITQQNAAGAEELASIMAMFRTHHESSEMFRHGKRSTQGKAIDPGGARPSRTGSSSQPR
ncbi:MAG: methyl-accepting chemotaxis protein [Syntrophales bacterium LBB04]|nr:methyl-accepting chemotaxis protein [Syntrophales bacterium LBB04]